MVQAGGAGQRPLAENEPVSGPASAWPFLGPLARTLEDEQERWFLWLPVMFGGGIAIYFLMPTEPQILAATLPAVAALAIHLAHGRSGLFALATVALLAMTLGVAASKLRTEAMRAPALERQIGPVDVSGFVELIEPRPTKGQRLTIRVIALEKLETHAWPYRVRIRTMTETSALEPGDAVRLRATLSPPPGPALPGDYDFARAAWFQALGRRRLCHGCARDHRRRAGAAAFVARDCGDRAGAASHRSSGPGGAARTDRRHRQRADHRRARRHLGDRPTRPSAIPACSTSSRSPACTW